MHSKKILSNNILMRQVYFSHSVYEVIDAYILQYATYFYQLYSDTGIWSEDQILAYYDQAATLRRDEIIDALYDTLLPEIIIGHSGQNTVKIMWRSKMLIVGWEERDMMTRIATSLEILKR